MFFRNYIYRLKCIVRDRQMMFWTLLFPILLATLFNLAFSNISSAENFSKINIAIVNNDEYYKDANFIKAINSVSQSGKSADKSNLFSVKYTTKEEAGRLLKDNKIDGYIFFDNGMKLFVKESGLNQTIIKSFLDDFKETSSTMSTIISKNPASAQNGLLQSISNREDYLKEVAASKSVPDNIVTYFYALIAMTCLYGSFWGLKEVVAIQANQSPQGARVNMAPTHKLKLFMASIFAAATIQLLEVFTLIGYLAIILKVSFGSNVNYIVLTCVVSTITGVTFGTFMASIIKKGEGIKAGILISSNMTMCFLAGLMYDKMKYIISANVPLLGYINPANLISDSFYSLYYYSTYTQFFTDIVLLCVFTIFFSTVTYLVLRRQKYASL